MFHVKHEREKVTEMMKLFAVHNLNSSRMAQYGKEPDVRKYVADLSKMENCAVDNDIDSQFEGLDFGK